MNTKPKSAYEQTTGMMWFPRMLDKIRIHACGELHPDFHSYLGKHLGVDGICCRFLQVAYTDLKDRVLDGGTDEEILEWCFENGRKLSETDLFIWNEFIKKFGWNDRATPVLQKFKEQSGLADRSDLLTMVEYMEVDEGRKP